MLRGSCDGFTPSDFHRLCDNKGPTVTVIKVQNTGQLIGGYTPSSWSSNSNRGWESVDDNFIFSLGKEMGDQMIQSKQKSGYACGVYCAPGYGPIFGLGNDLKLDGTNFQTNSKCYSKQKSYQLPIMNGAENRRVNFSVEEYEVFQVIEK